MSGLSASTAGTREIGLRRAVGASWQAILNQFLAESLAVTLVAGTRKRVATQDGHAITLLLDPVEVGRVGAHRFR